MSGRRRSCCLIYPALANRDRHALHPCRFYKIRITGAESQSIHAAVPAQCLQSGEKLIAVMTAPGELAGMSYDLSGVGLPMCLATCDLIASSASHLHKDAIVPAP